MLEARSRFCIHPVTQQACSLKILKIRPLRSIARYQYSCSSLSEKAQEDPSWTIRQLEDTDYRYIPQTASILAQSFQGSKSVEREIKRFLIDSLTRMKDERIILVALATAGPSPAASDAQSSETSDEQVVGTATMSVTARSQAVDIFLPVPPGCLYISNIAVVPSWQQRGLGTALLVACEGRSADLSTSQVCLQARDRDTAAVNLYKKNGYVPVKRDWWGLQFLGRARRQLWLKELKDS